MEAKVYGCGEVVVEPMDGKRVCGGPPAFLCSFRSHVSRLTLHL